MEKPIIDHYPHGVGRIIEQKRDEKHQLAEDVFHMLFYKAITLATTNKETNDIRILVWIRKIKQRRTIITDLFIMDTSTIL